MPVTYKPTETQCLQCGHVFLQPHRKQGGGVRSIYCSKKCRALHWARGNRGKRKATILKYEAVPENKEKKKLRSLQSKFNKYGISEVDFFTQLTRQNNSCYGCQTNITKHTACIDHDHDTGKVRGLLCKSCNWALGHLKDNKETLYRLSAYLEYDRTKKGIYLIGSLRNDNIPKVAKGLRESGFSVWDEWFSAGPEADDSFQKYHTDLDRNFKEALTSGVAQHIFFFDKARLDLCDVGVLVMPAGKSGHLELGYMAGRGKKTYILNAGEPDRFDIMPQFATAVCNNFDELLVELKKL